LATRHKHELKQRNHCWDYRPSV